MTRIPPGTIVAGLGTLGREEVCDLLAIFRDADLYNLAVDRFSDVAKLVSEKGAAQGDDTAFKKRLAGTAATGCSCSKALGASRRYAGKPATFNTRRRRRSGSCMITPSILGRSAKSGRRY